MNIQSNLLPHKHLRFSDSILGIGGLIKSVLKEPMTVDEIWSVIHKNSQQWPGRISYTNMVMGIYVLFTIGHLELLENGRLRVIDNEAH